MREKNQVVLPLDLGICIPEGDFVFKVAEICEDLNYTISTKYYSDEKCGRCPHRDKCHKSNNGYRTVKVNQVILEHSPRTLEALTSEVGTLLRMSRSIQVESVFCVLNIDYGFRCFLTRGKKNIETQFFLLVFALNIENLCNRTKKGRIGLYLFSLNAS